MLYSVFFSFEWNRLFTLSSALLCPNHFFYPIKNHKINFLFRIINEKKEEIRRVFMQNNKHAIKCMMNLGQEKSRETSETVQS